MRRLARALDAARLQRSRIGKEEAIGAALAAIAKDPSDGDGVALATAARLAAGRALPIGDGRSLGVGGSLLGETVTAQTGWAPHVVWSSARRTGDLGEAFGLLVARDPRAEDRPDLSLREVAELLDALASMGNRLAKRRRLDEAFARSTPLATKYLAKAMLGSLRVGAQGGVMEGAIARAFAVPVDDVRRAGALVTDPGALAVLARDGALAEARFELGRPVAYMLATPLETIASPIDSSLHVVEDKIDGVRAQIHKVGHDVAIFARGLERVTAAFPEVVDAFRFVPGSLALDGELVALSQGGRVRPFQALQARLRRIAPDPALVRETPTAFIAYDILHDGERDLLAEPWSERRAALEAFARTRGPSSSFSVNGCAPAPAGEGPIDHVLDAAFQSARARGHEGLVLKRVDAPYDAGRRGQAWIKVKRAFATLDVVLTAAQEGHGRRAGVLSDYTFGVWRGEEVVNVGKAYSGLTDAEIDVMQRRILRIEDGRFGGVRLVRPEIVIEVAFDGIQRSTRHKSGFALRFPRIVRVRDDKRAEDADRLEQVEALFASQMESGHREESPREDRDEAAAPDAAIAPAPATGSKKAKKARGDDRQLSLFGSPIDTARRRG